MRMSFNDNDLNPGKYFGAGRHQVRINRVAIEKSQAGNDCVAIYFVGIGASAGKEGNEKLPKFKVPAVAKACGISEAVLKSGEFDTDMLLGKAFDYEKVKTGVVVKNGKEQNVYDRVFHASTFESASIAASDDLPF